MRVSFCWCIATIFLLAGAAFAQESGQQEKRIKKEDVRERESTPDEPVVKPDVGPVVTPIVIIEKEIALVQIAKLESQIDLAKLAYQKARSEKVRQLASKLEAVYVADRDRLEAWSKAAVIAVPVERKIAKPIETKEPEAQLDRSPVVPDVAPRRTQGSQDPSFGGKPDAGNLDDYNRNTVNPKADKEVDRAVLKEKLKEQSTPTVTDKKREVEKPVTDSAIADRRPQLPSPWVGILLRIETEQRKQFREALAEKGGSDFDECYVAWLVGSQQAFLTADDAYNDFLSGELRRITSDTDARMKSHQKEAELLLAELKVPMEAPLTRPPPPPTPK